MQDSPFTPEETAEALKHWTLASSKEYLELQDLLFKGLISPVEFSQQVMHMAVGYGISV